MTEITTTKMERYLREKVLSYEPPYYLSFYSVEHVSKDFLREWKDLDWCWENKQFILQIHGEKIYRELFGEDK